MRNVRLAGDVALILAWGLAVCLAACGAVLVSVGSVGEAGAVYAGFAEIDERKSHFVIVGDTQRTSLWEFWRERNDRKRRLIADEIARTEPAFVLHLGDLTARGSSEEQWSEFDRLYRGVREKKIPLFPILGNHELYGSDREALHNYFQRFPHLGERRWYSFTWKNVGLILVDSNLSSLTSEQRDEQDRWYLSELDRMEKDGGVDHIIVACHHPPFTNSRVVSPSEEARTHFAEPFLRFNKTRLFFSGHAHTYERFHVRGKQFVVSGGGGGPRHKVAIDPERRPFPDAFNGQELRFFHFCQVESHGRPLSVQVLRFKPDESFEGVDILTAR